MANLLLTAHSQFSAELVKGPKKMLRRQDYALLGIPTKELLK